MNELLNRVELSFDDFIADLMAGNKSRLSKHAENFEGFLGEININIALADPEGMLKLTVPEGFVEFAAIGYKLRLIIDGIRAGVITP